MEESKYSIEFKTSRNGLTIPVVNGIHLHSIYNPTKEAEAFAENYMQNISDNSNILILGLGYGYHIEHIAKIINKLHHNYKITVLEPNKELVNEFNSKRPFEDKNIEIINPENLSDVFSNLSFINFLRTKPAIIKHDTSFTVNREFFTHFLKYQAPTKIGGYFALLNETASTYFQDIQDSQMSMIELSKKIKTQTGITCHRDYLILALDEIKTNVNKSQRGL